MATATAEAPKTAEGKTPIRELLRVTGVVPFKEVLEKTNLFAVEQAWCAGDMEFGRRKHCITGPVGKTGSSLVIEEGVEWTGQMGDFHARVEDFVTKDIPVCEKYCRADLPRVPVVDVATGHEFTEMAQVKRPEAVEMLGYVVRLTRKGMAAATA